MIFYAEQSLLTRCLDLQVLLIHSPHYLALCLIIISQCLPFMPSQSSREGALSGILCLQQFRRFMLQNIGWTSDFPGRERRVVNGGVFLQALRPLEYNVRHTQSLSGTCADIQRPLSRCRYSLGHPSCRVRSLNSFL